MILFGGILVMIGWQVVWEEVDGEGEGGKYEL